MDSPLDPYTLKARLRPGLLAALPIAIAVTAFFPEGVSWWTPLWAAIVACGGTYFLADLAREGGKRLEPGLFASWGGKPTSQLLRHRDASNPVKVASYHARLEKLRPDLTFPTPEQELEKPEHADHVYEAATDHLKELSRNDKLVFKANCEYGYRRNTLGLRPYGIATSLTGLLANAGALVAHYVADLETSLPIQFTATAINSLLAAAWLFAVRPEWVKTTAFAYAERLLAVLETSRSKGDDDC